MGMSAAEFEGINGKRIRTPVLSESTHLSFESGRWAVFTGLVLGAAVVEPRLLIPGTIMAIVGAWEEKNNQVEQSKSKAMDKLARRRV